MATQLAKIISDFETSLAVKMAIGATTGTLQSATDSDGIALPTGRYFFTMDRNNSSKEYISCTLTGTALTNIKSVSRQGAETVGTVREHRVGANVIISDFAHIKKINDLLDGTTSFDSATVLGYDGAPTISTGNQLTTKTYVDTQDALDVHLTGTQTLTGTKTFTTANRPKLTTDTDSVTAEELVTFGQLSRQTFSGAVNASTIAKGLVEEATQAQFDAGTNTGETGARLFVVPSVLKTMDNVTLVAGEALTTNDSVFIANGNESRQINAFSTTVSATEAVGSGVDPNWIYQSFTTGANTTKITRVKLYGSYTGNYPNSGGTVRIRSSASGSDLATGTFGTGLFTSGSEDIDIVSLTVSPSTVYYIVVSVAYTDPYSYKHFKGSAASTYSGGDSAFSTNGGTSWTTCTNVTGDFGFQVLEGDYTVGRAYKTTASTANNMGTGLTANFIGFALATVAASANIAIRVTGIMTALSGLTAGLTYYLSNTAGALSVSAGTVSKKIGIALSATELLIKHDN